MNAIHDGFWNSVRVVKSIRSNSAEHRRKKKKGDEVNAQRIEVKKRHNINITLIYHRHRTRNCVVYTDAWCGGSPFSQTKTKQKRIYTKLEWLYGHHILYRRYTANIVYNIVHHYGAICAYWNEWKSPNSHSSDFFFFWISFSLSFSVTLFGVHLYGVRNIQFIYSSATYVWPHTHERVHSF